MLVICLIKLCCAMYLPDGDFTGVGGNTSMERDSLDLA